MNKQRQLEQILKVQIEIIKFRTGSSVQPMRKSNIHSKNYSNERIYEIFRKHRFYAKSEPVDLGDKVRF